MLLDSAFGDLWMPLAVFVTLGVTLGIGLSRLLRCTQRSEILCGCIPRSGGAQACPSLFSPNWMCFPS